MNNVDINYLAVLVAAVSSMVIGSLWYGPLFGKMWMRWMGFREEDLKDGAMMAMGVAFLFSLVMAFVMAHFIQLLDATNYTEALQTAGWLWLGFSLASSVTNGMFSKMKPHVLILFGLYELVKMLVMAAILFAWQ